jgi:hypothetical protein
MIHDFVIISSFLILDDSTTLKGTSLVWQMWLLTGYGGRGRGWLEYIE